MKKKKGNERTQIATAVEKITSINPASPLRWNSGITRNGENMFVVSPPPVFYRNFNHPKIYSHPENSEAFGQNIIFASSAELFQFALSLLKQRFFWRK